MPAATPTLVEPHQYCSFYRYVAIDDVEVLRQQLHTAWKPLGLAGRIYLANEGVNAQFIVPVRHWAQFEVELRE